MGWGKGLLRGGKRAGCCGLKSALRDGDGGRGEGRVHRGGLQGKWRRCRVWGASGLAGGKLQRAAAVQGGMESGEAGDFLGLIGVKGG